MRIAILTGDIVKSSKLSAAQLQQLFSTLQQAADTITEWQDSPTRFLRFSGDAWQCLLVRPELALRASLLFRAHIRARSKTFETRIFAGFGPAQPVSPDGLGATDGVAFQASGRGLKAMRPAQYLGASQHNALFALADEVSRRWSPKQAQAFTYALQPSPPSQESIANRLGVSQQAIAKRLRAGGEWALQTAIDEIEFNTL